MFNNFSFGRYILNNSVVHRLSPVFKIISLIVMIISIFFIDSYKDILMLSSYLVLAIAYTGISFKVYFKNIYAIRIFLIFIIIIDLIFFISFDRIVFDLFKLIFIVLYSGLITFTTAMTEITYGISTILKPFSSFIPVNDVAMIITLTIRYIPTLTDEASLITKSQMVRGINFDSKNLRERIISISGTLIPMFVLSLRRAENLADMMDLRLYNFGYSRSNYRFNKWGILDNLLLIMNILILIVVILN